MEFLRNPAEGNVNTPFPNFSWIVNGEDSQNAYHILVATSRRKLDTGFGDLWDSGKIISKESVNITYKGVPLNSNTSYFWIVRIGTLKSKSFSISDIQEFKTGKFGDAVTSHNIFQMERIAPVSLVKQVDGSYFVDFGKDAFGTLELNYKTNKAETLLISLGEKLIAERL